MGLTFYLKICAAVFVATFTSSYVIAVLNFRTMRREMQEREQARRKRMMEAQDRMAAEIMIELSRHSEDEL
jgi:hypothetical protein